MRLLVAEDEKRLNKIICEALEDEGYSVDACFDGEQALEYARATEYDAMVMDIMMPRLDGLEAVRQMRREHICAPVLFLTARDSIADRVEGLESGGDYYLVKPFHFPELHLSDSDVEVSNIIMHDGLYEATLFTAWMHYECYVDAATGEVLGLNAEPMLLYSTDKHDGKFEHLTGSLRHSA